MLRAVLCISWKDNKTNEELYGNLQKATATLRVRRLRFIGDSLRRGDELISKVLLCAPKYGKRKRGRPGITYVGQVKRDTGINVEELQACMTDRERWKNLVNAVRVRSK